MSSAPKYQVLCGHKFPPGFDNIADNLTYQPRPDDVFIVTYPKNGTTWMQFIVTLILHDGDMPEQFVKDGLTTLCPFLEVDGKQAVMEAKRPCSIKTHLPYDLQPKHPDAKYIVVMRNAKDACVSFYYHQTMFSCYGIEGMDFHQFFPFWMKGEVESGDYFDFILSWWKERQNPNILFVLYEEMKADPHAAVLRIAEFLGQEYANRMRANNNEILNKVVEKSSFTATKDKQNGDFLDQWPEFVFAKDSPRRFARKGIVGDWENHLTEDESRAMDQAFHQKFDGTGLETVWSDYAIFS